MKNSHNIVCYNDLEREEILVKKRIKEQEQEMTERFKRLPEEMVITGITHMVTTVKSGKILNFGGKIISRTIAYFINKKSHEGEPQGFKKILYNLLEKLVQ